MTEIELRQILGDTEGVLSASENLFESGVIDSLSAVELIERIAQGSDVLVTELVNDLERISSIEKILVLFESRLNRGLHG